MYSIPYQLQRDNTRNMAVVHSYNASEKEDRRAKKGNKQKGNEKKETKINMHSGRRPSPEETKLLLAGTISSMICPGDRPTEGRHDKTRRKTRQENEI